MQGSPEKRSGHEVRGRIGVRRPRHVERDVADSSYNGGGTHRYDLVGAWRRGITVHDVGVAERKAYRTDPPKEVCVQLPRAQIGLDSGTCGGLRGKVVSGAERQKAVPDFE